MSAGEYSGLRVSAPNGVKVYQVTSGKDAPKWLSEKHKRKLRKDSEFGRRVELVQDLEFSCASSRAKLSPDGNFLLVSGIHPPQVKVYDLSQLSMKFERHLDSEVVDFCVLGEDYSKLAFMCADRTINFHAKFGKYYTTRTPRQGRDMTYVRHTGDLMVVGGSCDVYRLNLEQGRFLAPMKLATSEGGNKIAVSAEHGLCAVGKYFPITTFRRLIAHTRLTLSFYLRHGGRHGGVFRLANKGKRRGAERHQSRP